MALVQEETLMKILIMKMMITKYRSPIGRGNVMTTSTDQDSRVKLGRHLPGWYHQTWVKGHHLEDQIELSQEIKADEAVVANHVQAAASSLLLLDSQIFIQTPAEKELRNDCLSYIQS